MEPIETTFSNFLKGKFVTEFSPRYYSQHGEAPDEHDFAVWLGLSDQAYSQYKLGKRRPTIQVAEKLADRLKDPRVYDILGYPRRMPKDPLSIFFVDNVHELSEEDKAEIKSIIERRLEERENRTRKRGNNVSALA